MSLGVRSLYVSINTPLPLCVVGKKTTEVVNRKSSTVLFVTSVNHAFCNERKV